MSWTDYDFDGQLAGTAGQPIVIPPITLYQRHKGGPVLPLVGASVTFELLVGETVVLTMGLGSGMFLEPLRGRLWGDSSVQPHAPLAAKAYSYRLVIRNAAAAVLIRFRGRFVVEAP